MAFIVFSLLAVDVFDPVFMAVIWRLFRAKQLRRVLENAVDDALHGNRLVVDVEDDRDFDLRAFVDEVDLGIWSHWRCPLLLMSLLYQTNAGFLTTSISKIF